MNTNEKKQMEAEIKERRSGAYSKLIEANIDLSDRIRWIKEDIERIVYKLNTSDLTKEEIIDSLEKVINSN